MVGSGGIPRVELLPGIVPGKRVVLMEKAGSVEGGTFRDKPHLDSSGKEVRCDSRN